MKKCMKCGEQLREGWYHACDLNLTNHSAFGPPTACKGSCGTVYWGLHPKYIACTDNGLQQLNGQMVPEDRHICPSKTVILHEASTYELVAELVRRGCSDIITPAARVAAVGEYLEEVTSDSKTVGVNARKPTRADTEARLKSGKDYCSNPESYRGDWDD